MESEQLSLTRHQSQQIIIPECIKSEKSTQVCQNPQCKHFVFLCSNEDCPCQAEHQLCIKVALKPLIRIVSKKRQKTDNDLGKYIQKVTDDLIDQISQIRDDILNRLNYLGLNDEQRLFMTLMETKAYDKINAKSIHGICANAHVKESISLQNSIEYVQYNWQKDKKKFKEILNHLTVTVTKSLNGSPILKSLDSKIIEADNFIDLCDMFPQKITNMELLYRGSQHGFSISVFRNMCEKRKNNLCIVRTEAGNIIGAYTPITWDAAKNSQYGNDPSLQTFIFSLTMKKKFVQTNGGNQATHHYTNWGPRFGTDGTCDLAIGQNGNNGSSNCYANICNLFMPENPEDQKNLDYFKQNFIGGGVKGTSKFKITEWEMYEVHFD